MCMFDVRTSRKKVGNSLLNRVVTAAAPATIPRNGNRTAIAVTVAFGTDPAVAQGSVALSSPDLQGAPFCRLNVAYPFVLLTLEEWGQLVTGAITVTPDASGNQNVSVVEIAYLEELEKL